MNYTLEQYATDVVYRVKSICDDAGVPHPDIITESGRALVAHSGLLVFQVLGSRVFPETPDQALVDRALAEGDEDEVPQPLLDLVDAYQRLGDGSDVIEIYHDAEHALNEAMSLFNLGYMSITARAACEELYWATGTRLVKDFKDDLTDELLDLPERLGDIYFSNFSVFQSLIDSWGIDQIFPIMPIHRLDEQPTRRATLADITCDSDGRVDRFAGPEGPQNTLALHALKSGASHGGSNGPPNGSNSSGSSSNGSGGATNGGTGGGPAGDLEPYYLGVFLTGAYQETLGDLHNLFGDTHAVHVVLSDDGAWHLEEVVEGDTVREVLQFVQFDPDGMRRSMRREIEAALATKQLTLQEAVSMRRFLDQGLDGYTYLE
jgi:arginine decarboxylase